jgi:hypothetical protein
MSPFYLLCILINKSNIANKNNTSVLLSDEDSDTNKHNVFNKG